jgi:hypothetical protein
MNKMKNILKIFIGLFLILSVNSCTDDYFDVNTPSSAANEEELRMSDLLAPAIYHTVTAQYYAARSFGNYSQYFTGQGGGTTVSTSNSSSWSQIYLYTLPNLKIIKKKAAESNAIHYDAVANILIAMNIGLATDSWDWIPYSEASQGIDNIKPAFDSQNDIYTEIESLLDNAISNLNKNDESVFSIGNDDIVYGGNIDKWKRLAYTLKARYSMHLTQKNGVSAANNALTYLANGFNSNDDDFEITYEEKNMNPWFTREVKARQTSNAHDKIGDQLVSYMDGTSYPFESGLVTLDPRLPVIAEKEDPDAPFRGYITGGDGLSSDGEDANTNFKDGGFYTNLSAPITLISYSEALFLKAEAEFLVAGGTTTSVGSNAAAYDAYINGIVANMNKLNVNNNDYIADTAIGMGEANFKLEHLMKEKYIANFLNPETYNDLRRYDFSTDVFKDFALPLDHAETEYPGKFMLRVTYPSSEETRNPDNVAAHKQAPTTPVWWNE